jgi:hypothetical protein
MPMKKNKFFKIIIITFLVAFFTSAAWPDTNLPKIALKITPANFQELNNNSKLEVLYYDNSNFRVENSIDFQNDVLLINPETENNKQENEIIVPRLIGRALPYPNPMNFNKGGGEIGYLLSTDMNMELRVYDMGLNLVYQQKYIGGFEGAHSGYNKVPFNEIVVGYPLATGVYFYILIYEGKILAREKLVIIR